MTEIQQYAFVSGTMKNMPTGDLVLDYDDDDIWCKYSDHEADRRADKKCIVAFEEAGIYAHGVLRCPKCKMRLIKTIISMVDGKMYADNKPAYCPNDCGPLWRVTWRDEAQENMELVEKFQESIAKLEAEVKSWAKLATQMQDQINGTTRPEKQG